MRIPHNIPVTPMRGADFGILKLEDYDRCALQDPHRHDFFQLLWFTSPSSSEHSIDFEPCPVRPGVLYRIAPGQIHAYSGSMPAGYAIVFSLEMFANIRDYRLRSLFNPFLNKGMEIGEGEAAVLEGIAALMLAETAGAGEFSILLAYLEAFLSHLCRLHASATLFNQVDERLGRLFDLVEEKFRSERRAAFYASAIGISPKRLNEILMERFGLTITRILHVRLILEAKREIACGARSLKQISWELGFSDQSYFSRFFKLHAGLMPAEFRKQFPMAVSEAAEHFDPIQ